jgi:hypothetical protein
LTSERDNLRTLLSTAQTELTTARGQIDTNLAEAFAIIDAREASLRLMTAERDAAHTQIVVLNETITTLNGQVSNLQASQSDFDSRLTGQVVADLCKLGIRKGAIGVGRGTSIKAEDETITERCLRIKQEQAHQHP